MHQKDQKAVREYPGKTQRIIDKHQQVSQQPCRHAGQSGVLSGDVTTLDDTRTCPGASGREGLT